MRAATRLITDIVRYLADRIGELGSWLSAGDKIPLIDHKRRDRADARLHESLLRCTDGLGGALGVGNGRSRVTVKPDLLRCFAQNHGV